jgi:hypothetical protein
VQSTESGTRRLRQVVLAAALALAAYAVVTSDARANFYPFDGRSPIVSRTANGATDAAYAGPEFRVYNGTSTDTYECPLVSGGGGVHSTVTDYLAVVTDLFARDQAGNEAWSSDLGYSVGSDASLSAGDTFHVTVTSWYPNGLVMHLLASCTTDYNVFPYHYGSYGPYLDHWNASLQAQRPDFVTLVQQAFNWGSTGMSANPASAVAASARSRRPGTRFALHNGTNAIRMPFGQVARSARALTISKRPPAIYLSTRPAGAHCRAKQLQVPVINGSGTVSLNLQCHGLKSGASARVRVHKAIQRSFALHKGEGRFNIHLDKPPGTIPPFVYVSTHPAKTPCSVVHRKVHLRPRTLDLHMVARCKQVPRKATGTLYVGGLLAANR